MLSARVFSSLRAVTRPHCARNMARAASTSLFDESRIQEEMRKLEESLTEEDLTFNAEEAANIALERRAQINELESSWSSQDYQRMQSQQDWAEMQTVRASQKQLVDHFSEFGSTQSRESTFQPHHALHKPLPPSQVTLSALLAAGAHMGHARGLLNPNFMPYAYGVRAGITIIDLDQTLPLLRRAANLVRSVAQRNGTILFIGTRPDLRPVVLKAAERLGKQQGYYVGERWLPGTLTNKQQLFGPDVVATEKIVPDLVVLLNPLANMNAIRECAISHVPTIGVIDSNVDPRIVMYPIPANDESTRTAEVIAGVLSVAGREGVALREAGVQPKSLSHPKPHPKKKGNQNIYNDRKSHSRPQQQL